jgi:hypothetical protein
MSKPVVALLAGLAVVAAAGRARRGSFASGSRAHRFGTYTMGLTPQRVIRQAVAHEVGEAGTYPMELVGTDQQIALEANERAGISPFRFNARHKLGLKYTADELVAFLAALKAMEAEGEFSEDDETPGMLRSSILETLGIEEV